MENTIPAASHGGFLRQMLDDVIHGALRPPPPYASAEGSGVIESAAARTRRDSELLTPGQVAALFDVVPTTVLRWAKSGKISSTTTAGGHHRYFRTEICALLDDLKTPGPAL
ncbi:helix-turn-helix domain-containing protein [Rhodococcus qingshengii]